MKKESLDNKRDFTPAASVWTGNIDAKGDKIFRRGKPADQETIGT